MNPQGGLSPSNTDYPALTPKWSATTRLTRLLLLSRTKMESSMLQSGDSPLHLANRCIFPAATIYPTNDYDKVKEMRWHLTHGAQSYLGIQWNDKIDIYIQRPKPLFSLGLRSIQFMCPTSIFWIRLVRSPLPTLVRQFFLWALGYLSWITILTAKSPLAIWHLSIMDKYLTLIQQCCLSLSFGVIWIAQRSFYWDSTTN